MFGRMLALAAVLATGQAVVPASGHAQGDAYAPGPKVREAYAAITARPEVRKALESVRADHEATMAEQRRICEIPAPPFREQARAAYLAERLTALGLKDVRTDAEGNVLAVRPGTGGGPKLLVCAHLDTVFEAGTDVAVREKDGRLHAPGIADNARGLAAMLAVIRGLDAGGVKTVGDILFCANVGEEGLGDLRGVKALFRDLKDIDGFIAVDGVDADQVTFLATGSRRYEVTFTGPGGHSFAAFGRPSAIHALGRAVARIADLETPKKPKTTFTVGVVSGGTSVNSIAAKASLLMDMRSDSTEALGALEAKFLEIAKQAAADENRRWGAETLAVEMKLVGDRPAGSQPADAVIVQASWAAIAAAGGKPALIGAKSTDANVPIALGVPAVTLGGGGRQDNNHSPNEWYDPAGAYHGPQRVLLTAVGLVGLDGAAVPLLVKR